MLRFPSRRYAQSLRARTAKLYTAAEIFLILAVTAAVVQLFWTLLRPMGPVGRWRSTVSIIGVFDPLILTRFDPFFRNAIVGPTTVTSLSLKLFGTRLDQAMGRSSAIIATPDGLQTSYAVGDEIVPGVQLKAVAFDSVTIGHGGVSEQLFLDQSAATAVLDPRGQTGASPAVTGKHPPLTSQSAITGISFAPRTEKGAVTGFIVGPKGAGEAFAASGLVQGDVVTQINSIGIRTVDDAIRAMGNLPADGRISFTVDRGGKTVVVSAGPTQ